MSALERAADLRRLADAIEANADLLDDLGPLSGQDTFYVASREQLARVIAAFPDGTLTAVEGGNATWTAPFGESELRFAGRADNVLDRVEVEQTATVVEYRLPTLPGVEA